MSCLLECTTVEEDEKCLPLSSYMILGFEPSIRRTPFHISCFNCHCHTKDPWQENHRHSQETVRHALACFSHSVTWSKQTALPWHRACRANTHLLCTPARTPTSGLQGDTPSQQDVHINERWVSVLHALPCLLLNRPDQQGVCSISETLESVRMGHESDWRKTYSLIVSWNVFSASLTCMKVWWLAHVWVSANLRAIHTHKILWRVRKCKC